MSYQDKEESTHDGRPIFLYRWAVGATVYRYTSAGRRIEITLAPDSLTTYIPHHTSHTEEGHSNEDHAGAVRVKTDRLDPVTFGFILYGPTVPVALTIYRMHLSDPDGEVIVVHTGKVAQVDFQGSEVILTSAPLTAILDRNLPRTMQQKLCPWALYSEQCGVDRNLHRVSGPVLGWSGNTITVTNFGTKPDGYFQAGWVENALGERRYITSHVGTTITLQSPFQSIAVGQTVTAQAGCLRREQEDCHVKFNNVLNFGGQARISPRNPYELGTV